MPPAAAATVPERPVTIRVEAPAAAPPGVQDQAAPVSAQANRAPPSAEQLEQKRQLMASTVAGLGATAAADAPPAKPAEREDVESVQLRMPNGDLVDFAPPRSASLRISMMLGPEMTQYDAHMFRTLMSVRSINGVPPQPITNRVDAMRMAQELGDDALDHLGLALTRFWPTVTMGDLVIVKKNLRGP